MLGTNGLLFLSSGQTSFTNTEDLVDIGLRRNKKQASYEHIDAQIESDPQTSLSESIQFTNKCIP
jgi:hypothetical protein